MFSQDSYNEVSSDIRDILMFRYDTKRLSVSIDQR